MRIFMAKVFTAVVLCLALSLAVFAAKTDNDRKERTNTKATVIKTKNGTTTRAAREAVESLLEKATVKPTTPTTEQQKAAPRAGEEINWQVIASGGGLSTIGSMMLGSTIGQTAAGQSTIGDYTLISGFQQNFEPGSETCCIPPMRGDVNYDGAELIDISDLFYLIDFMFTGGPAPVCFEEADIDASGSEPLDISDLVLLIDYMFLGGDPPPACP